MPSAMASTASVNSSREPVRATWCRIQGTMRRPPTSISATKTATLSVVIARPVSSARAVRVALPSAQRRQEDQRQDHREVLDDQPADRDAAVLRVELVALLERAQQHDGAGDREREAEDQPGGQAPAPPARERRADRGRDGDLRHRAGQRDGAHPQQRRRSRSAGRRRTSAGSRRSRRAREARSASATNPGVNGPMAMPASR